MGDLISRKALVKALIAEHDKHPPEVEERYSFGVKLPHRYNQAIRGGIRKALREIEMAPAIDAVPVVHGRWIYDANAQDWGIGGFMCSECDALNHNLPANDKIHTSWFVGSNYCPNCGAKMDEEADDALD